MRMAYLKEWEQPMKKKKEKKPKEKEERKNGGPPTHPLYSPLSENQGSCDNKEKRNWGTARPPTNAPRKMLTPEASRPAEKFKSLPVAHPPARTYPSP